MFKYINKPFMFLTILVLNNVCIDTRTVQYRRIVNSRCQTISHYVQARSAISCCSLCSKTSGCQIVNFSQTFSWDNAPIVLGNGWAMYYQTDFRCMLGWNNFGNVCFYLDLVPRARDAAGANCEGMVSTAHLVDIKTSDDSAILSNMLIGSTIRAVRAWIGGIYTADGYVWTDGDFIDEFESWGQKEPAGPYHGEYCMFISSPDWNKWGDIKCDALLPSVCQYQLG